MLMSVFYPELTLPVSKIANPKNPRIIHFFSMFNEEKNTIENVEKSSPNWEEGAVKISDMSVSLSVCSLAFEKIENL